MKHTAPVAFRCERSSGEVQFFQPPDTEVLTAICRSTVLHIEAQFVRRHGTEQMQGAGQGTHAWGSSGGVPTPAEYSSRRRDGVCLSGVVCVFEWGGVCV